MALTTKPAPVRLGLKGGDHSSNYLLDCLARFMRDNYTLQQRQAYIKKLPPHAAESFKQRLIKAYQQRKPHKHS